MSFVVTAGTCHEYFINYSDSLLAHLRTQQLHFADARLCTVAHYTLIIGWGATRIVWNVPGVSIPRPVLGSACNCVSSRLCTGYVCGCVVT